MATLTPRRLRGSKLSQRPFYATVFTISCLAAYSFVAHSHYARNTQREALSALQPNLLVSRGNTQPCDDIHGSLDKCAFVRENCGDDEAGLLSYLTIYYCGFGDAQSVAFVFLMCWLGLLFTTIGTAASDFFSVNLSTIASILGLSESLAGVTFLAFGNGSPDVFSTFAAMASNSPSMAVGELIGAASFITAVVAGSMALVREFRVGRRTYVRDILCFIVAVVFAMAFLADGHLHLWECVAMIVYYVFYVILVVSWHWFETRHKRKRARDALIRSNVYGAPGLSSDELAPEPYRDDPDEEASAVGGRASGRGSHTDVSALESAGPRIEVEGEVVDVEGQTSPLGDDDDEQGRHVAAEMASSMRVLRPRGRRSTTITPIRPSLVGALEFRSALAQLQKESNLRMRRMEARGRSHGRAYSDAHIEGIHSETAAAAGVSASSHQAHVFGERHAPGRNRALSANDVPPNYRNGPPYHHPESVDGPSGTGASTPSLAPSQGTAFQIGGNLAPPPVDPGAGKIMAEPLQHQREARLPQLQLPPSSTGAGSDPSSPTTPFPVFCDSPLLLTPNDQGQAETGEYFAPSGPARREGPVPLLPFPDPKPVSWWPYAILPPPHVVRATLFPTLQGWREKTAWDKFVSTISVPSILLLVTTLPVVETDTMDDDSSVHSMADPPRLGEPGHTGVPVAVEHNGSIQPETEWQRYRRVSRSRSRSNTGQRTSRRASPRTSTQPSPSHSPLLIAVDEPTPPEADRLHLPQPAKGTAALPPNLPSESDALTLHEDEKDDPCWNRWLVTVQIFTGPLFAVFILWANMREDFENPRRTLVEMIAGTLVVSCVLCVILMLTTSPDRKPKYHFILCFMGFIISIAWISTIAGEVVGVLKAFGIILNISEALLGLTVFAAGNSVGDLVADVTVARLGYPVMALSACFGGPMLNILLGIGLGGVFMMIQAANHRLKKHPDKPYKYKPYKIKIDGTLMISAIILLLTLLILLTVVPMNKWVLSRRIGYGLISLWVVGTIINVVVEVTGVWAEV